VTIACRGALIADPEGIPGMYGPQGPSTGGGIMTVTGIITAIIIGAIIGALGRLVVPGRQPIPIWLTIVVGIVAAFIGTALARALGISTNTSGIDWLELLVQVVIAAIGVVITANLWARRGVRR
jgi:uncharacterized membrane protein YeaQ/YmgE (transglycosylase-associated protein family)